MSCKHSKYEHKKISWSVLTAPFNTDADFKIQSSTDKCVFRFRQSNARGLLPAFDYYRELFRYLLTDNGLITASSALFRSWEELKHLQLYIRFVKQNRLDSLCPSVTEHVECLPKLHLRVGVEFYYFPLFTRKSDVSESLSRCFYLRLGAVSTFLENPWGRTQNK